MKMLEKNTQYPLTEIIKWAIDIVKKTGDFYDDFMYFDLYTENDDMYANLDINESYYYADYPEVTDDYEEIYPEIYYSKKLSVIYTGETFMGVICSVYEQKPHASFEEYVLALNYYYENDDFLDLE